LFFNKLQFFLARKADALNGNLANSCHFW